jgi:hypothetical protein
LESAQTLSSVFEDSICANAPGLESAQTLSSVFCIEYIAVTQETADNCVLPFVSFSVACDQWTFRVILNARKRLRCRMQ